MYNIDYDIYTSSMIYVDTYPMIEIKFKDGKTHTYPPLTHECHVKKYMERWADAYYHRIKFKERRKKINKIINAK